MLALKRMALLSKSDCTVTPTCPGEGKNTHCFIINFISLELFYFPHLSWFLPPLFHWLPPFSSLCPRLPPEPWGRASPAVSGAQNARSTPVHTEPAGPVSGSGIHCPSLLSRHRYTLSSGSTQPSTAVLWDLTYWFYECSGPHLLWELPSKNKLQ